MKHTVRERLELRRNRRRAGGRARRRYAELRKEWLRRTRRVWLIVALAGAAFVAVFAAVLALFPGDHEWMVGFAAGGLVGVLISLRASPPQRIASWEEGAWGEEKTAKELVALERSGWLVLHDLVNGSANFDHVILGPTGVYCLNSKWSSYDLKRDADGRLVGRHRHDDEVTMNLDTVTRRAKAEAAALSEQIARRCGRKLWVRPVIVWWGDVEGGGRELDGVGIVQGKNLVDRLRDQNDGVPMRDYAEIEAALRPGRHADGRQRRTLVTAQRDE